MQNGVQFTEEGYLKSKIWSMNINGGLKNQNRTQHISCFHYKKMGDLPSKVVLEFGIYDTKENRYVEGEKKSIRFATYGELCSFIKKLQPLVVWLGREQRVINQENTDYYFQNEIKDLKRMFGGELT